MKLILAVLLLLPLLLGMTSCLRNEGTPPYRTDSVSETETQPNAVTEVPTDTAESEVESESEYIPPEITLSEAAMKWIENRENSEDIIMTADEISAENARIVEEAESVIDILDFKATHTKAELLEYLTRDTRPALPRYDIDGDAIAEEHYTSVLNNIADEMIEDENITRRGIVTSRANLRSIPDSKPYRKAPDNPYDSVQRTELHVGTPVWILHTSRDGKYFFVRSYHYAGWVDIEDIAFTDDEAMWLSFADPESFVCITEPSVILEGEELDMGVKLPLISAENGGYNVTLPVRDTDGVLGTESAVLAADSAVIGYLPYTYKNFIAQAFKYEGVMYSWGGLDSGVDCSSFVSNVMCTFGFMLPRDTRDQESVVGISHDVRGKNHDELSVALSESDAPTAVYYPGHVLFYLGKSDDGSSFSFIHAPQIGEAVSVTEKTDLSGMTFICEFASRMPEE